MKIISRGLPRAERKWRGKCQSCDAVVEATQSEITHEDHCQREHYSFSWEACPACGAGDKATGYGGLLMYPVKEST